MSRKLNLTGSFILKRVYKISIVFGGIKGASYTNEHPLFGFLNGICDKILRLLATLSAGFEAEALAVPRADNFTLEIYCALAQ